MILRFIALVFLGLFVIVFFPIWGTLVLIFYVVMNIYFLGKWGLKMWLRFFHD